MDALSGNTDSTNVTMLSTAQLVAAILHACINACKLAQFYYGQDEVAGKLKLLAPQAIQRCCYKHAIAPGSKLEHVHVSEHVQRQLTLSGDALPVLPSLEVYHTSRGSEAEAEGIRTNAAPGTHCRFPLVLATSFVLH